MHHILSRESGTETYRWGDQSLELHRCRTCGCVTHGSPVEQAKDRMGVNVRLMSPDILAAAWVRHLDGADTWKYSGE